MSALPSTFELIRDHGTRTNLVCSCCHEACVWTIGTRQSSYTLCSWCDVEIYRRFKS